MDAHTNSQLVYGVIEYLKRSKGAMDEDSQESLSIAVECLESVFNIDSTDEESLAGLKTGLSLDAIFVAGLEALRAKSETTPAMKEKAEALKETGNAAFKDKDYETAISFYSQAIDLHPENALLYGNRAAAHINLKQYREAIEDCKKGILINPAYSKAYGRLGSCHFQQGRYADAIDAYKKALEIEPTSESYKVNLEAATRKLEHELVASTSNPAASPAAAAAPKSSPIPNMPDFSGAGGMPDLSTLMSDPAMMQAAQRFMSSGAAEQLMKDPNIMNLASQFMNNNNNGNSRR